MLKVAGSVPSRGCTDLYCARGTHGILSKRVEATASQLDLTSLTITSIAGCG